MMMAAWEYSRVYLKQAGVLEVLPRWGLEGRRGDRTLLADTLNGAIASR